jgi:hypothetical protein
MIDLFAGLTVVGGHRDPLHDLTRSVFINWSDMVTAPAMSYKNIPARNVAGQAPYPGRVRGGMT